MYDEIVPAIENSILSASGAIPVVFEGLSHTLEHKNLNPSLSKHTSHELLLVRNGKLILTIDDEELEVDKGTTIIIKPNTLHSVKIPSGTAEVFVLYFSFEKDAETVKKMLTAASEPHQKTGAGPSVNIPNIADQTSIESFIDFVTGSDKDELQKASHIVISGTYKKDISSIVERIVSEQENNRYAKDAMMQILTLELMITISRSMKREWEESLRVRNGKARELVLIAKEYIDTNFDRGITVSDVAAYVFLSQGYFTRAFREEFGISPMGYLMNVRIMKACDLLEDNEIKVSAIALQTGFASPQRFNVAFRNHMGMTPLEYRKVHNNN